MPQQPLGIVTAQRAGSTSFQSLLADSEGSLKVLQAEPANYASAFAGRIGIAMNQAGATLSAALATTYTGLCLSNPAGSVKNLVLIRLSGSFNVAPAALDYLGLITGFAAGGITVHTTALTPQNGIIGAASPALVGLADAACTLVGTPVWTQLLGETPGATSVLSFNVVLDGAIIIPPGGYAAVGSSAAGPSAGFVGSMIWAEVPIAG